MASDAAVLPVERWFGPRFAELHPGLQALHRHGGRLHGPVELRRGRGIAGVFAAVLMRRSGLNPASRRQALTVVIVNDVHGLHWSRRFDGGGEAVSWFRPVGRWPEGYWIEESGPLRLKLDIDVVDGGWYWRLREFRVLGLRLPLWLAPRVEAGKSFRDGEYCFEVRIVLPLIGEALSYCGNLRETSAVADFRDSAPAD